MTFIVIYFATLSSLSFHERVYCIHMRQIFTDTAKSTTQLNKHASHQLCFVSYPPLLSDPITDLSLEPNTCLDLLYRALNSVAVEHQQPTLDAYGSEECLIDIPQLLYKSELQEIHCCSLTADRVALLTGPVTVTKYRVK